jgi:hypothetical protein
VRCNRLNSCIADFLPTGHSKTDVDRLFARIASTLTSEDYFNQLYVHNYVELTLIFSTMQHIIERIATCNIFWAVDFKYWRNGVNVLYHPRNIEGFSNYGIFHGSNTQQEQLNIFELWNIKYVI